MQVVHHFKVNIHRFSWFCGIMTNFYEPTDFLKQNMKLAKAAMPKATHGEVMRALSERWKASGGAKSPAEIIESGEDPLAVQRQHAEHWQGLALEMQGLSIN